MNCPHCGSSEIRYSYSSQWSDTIHRVLGRDAYRCRKCQVRFFQRRVKAASGNLNERGEKGEQHSEFMRRKRLTRRLLTVAVLVLMFSVFGLFLLRITKDHPPPISAQGLDQ